VEAINSAFRSSRLQKERDSLIARLERQVRETTVLSRVGQLVTSSLEQTKFAPYRRGRCLPDGRRRGFLLLYDAQSEEMTLERRRTWATAKSRSGACR